ARLRQSVRLIDESYNSNPASMLSTLQVLGEVVPAEDGRRIVVFGDMLELGETSVESHREIGRAVAASGADVLIGVGDLAAETIAAAGEGVETHHFASSADASVFVAGMARRGDVLLVKGSRGVALEKVVVAIKERFGEE